MFESLDSPQIFKLDFPKSVGLPVMDDFEVNRGPGYLRIQLLDTCNERCGFCYNEGSDIENRTIDEDMFWRIISASVNLGKKKFGFTGGEPTIHPKFSDYVLQLKSFYPSSHLNVTTNGTKLDSLAKGVLDGGIDKLTVSLHSLNEAKYNAITKTGFHKKVLSNLETLRDYPNMDVSLNMVVGRENLNEVIPMIGYARERGFELKILDILGDVETHVPYDQIQEEIDLAEQTYGSLDEVVRLKSKNYSPKCDECFSKPVCGEGNYLRLTVDARLMPCLYRPDLVQKVNNTDSDAVITDKIALGFRRIVYDNK